MCDIRRTRSASYSRQRPEDIPDDDIGLCSRPVKLVVSSERVFYVHEKLVRSKSHFLDAAFLKASLDDQRHLSVHIPDDDPDCLNAYLHWLYSGSFRFQLLAASVPYLFLAKLFVFGEKHQERAFQDAVVNEIIQEHRRSMENGLRTNLTEPGVVIYIFNNTPRESPIRKLMVDMALVYSNVDWFTNAKPAYPNEYLEEVVRAFIQCATDQTLMQDIKFRLDSGDSMLYHFVVRESRERRRSASGSKPEVKVEDRSRRMSTAWDGYARESTLKVPNV